MLEYVSVAIAAVATTIGTSIWIAKAASIGLVGRDMNKYEKPLVAESGGIAVIIGAATGMLSYAFIRTFFYNSTAELQIIFALVATLLLSGFIGFVDDILGWKKGISHKGKVLSTFFITLPLVALNMNNSVINLPFVGELTVGLFYPLLIVPLGIIGASNAFNMLAGYNGLEAGMGTIITSTLGIVAIISGHYSVGILAFIIAGSLLAFLWHNKVPAKVFPGDSLTYPIGAMIAALAIIGNMEKVAIVLFLPYLLVEGPGFLKYLIERHIHKDTKLPEAFATTVHPDNSIEFNAKIYGFEPLGYKIAGIFKKKIYEKDVVTSILIVELLLAIVAVVLWFNSYI